MSDRTRPGAEGPSETEGPRDETARERERRLVGREVGAEDEERKSPGGPQAQVAPDVEPAGG
jgi:hypothetical protein